MQDIEKLKPAKEQCIGDLTDALPSFRQQLDDIDTRLAAYIDDALSSHASHANLYNPLPGDTARGQVRGIHYSSILNLEA